MPQSCCEQIIYCTDSTPCASENIIQTITVVQQQQPQQYICIDSCPSTVINQAPMICTAPTTSASPKYICIPQKNQVLIQPQQQKQAEYLHISSASPQIIRTVSVPSGGAGNVQLGVNPTSNVVQGPSLFRTALVSVSFILHVFEQNCFNRSMMIIQSVSKAAGVPFVGRSNGNVIQLASAAASPRYR